MTTNCWNRMHAGCINCSIPCQHSSFLLSLEKYSTKCVWCMIPLTYVEHSFFTRLTSPSSHYAVCSCSQFFYIVIFSQSLRTSQPHHHHHHHLLHHRLHPVWSLSPAFQLAAAGEESQGEERKVWDKTMEGPRLFVFARSCQSLQLCGAEELVQSAEELLCSCQRRSLMLFRREAKSAEGEGRAQRAVPQAPSNEFMFRAQRGKMTLLWHILVCDTVFTVVAFTEFNAQHYWNIFNEITLLF